MKTEEDVLDITRNAKIIAQLYCCLDSRYAKKKCVNSATNEELNAVLNVLSLLTIGDIPIRKEVSHGHLKKSGLYIKLYIKKIFKSRDDLVTLKSENKLEKVALLAKISNFYHLFFNLMTPHLK
jgi:hypothetical protein